MLPCDGPRVVSEHVTCRGDSPWDRPWDIPVGLSYGRPRDIPWGITTPIVSHGIGLPHRETGAGPVTTGEKNNNNGDSMVPYEAGRPMAFEGCAS